MNHSVQSFLAKEELPPETSFKAYLEEPGTLSFLFLENMGKEE